MSENIHRSRMHRGIPNVFNDATTKKMLKPIVIKMENAIFTITTGLGKQENRSMIREGAT